MDRARERRGYHRVRPTSPVITGEGRRGYSRPVSLAPTYSAPTAAAKAPNPAAALEHAPLRSRSRHQVRGCPPFRLVVEEIITLQLALDVLAINLRQCRLDVGTLARGNGHEGERCSCLIGARFPVRVAARSGAVRLGRSGRRHPDESSSAGDPRVEPASPNQVPDGPTCGRVVHAQLRGQLQSVRLAARISTGAVVGRRGRRRCGAPRGARLLPVIGLSSPADAPRGLLRTGRTADFLLLRWRRQQIGYTGSRKRSVIRQLVQSRDASQRERSRTRSVNIRSTWRPSSESTTSSSPSSRGRSPRVVATSSSSPASRWAARTAW